SLRHAPQLDERRTWPYRKGRRWVQPIDRGCHAIAVAAAKEESCRPISSSGRCRIGGEGGGLGAQSNSFVVVAAVGKNLRRRHQRPGIVRIELDRQVGMSTRILETGGQLMRPCDAA